MVHPWIKWFQPEVQSVWLYDATIEIALFRPKVVFAFAFLSRIVKPYRQAIWKWILSHMTSRSQTIDNKLGTVPSILVQLGQIACIVQTWNALPPSPIDNQYFQEFSIYQSEHHRWKANNRTSISKNCLRYLQAMTSRVDFVSDMKPSRFRKSRWPRSRWRNS